MGKKEVISKNSTTSKYQIMDLIKMKIPPQNYYQFKGVISGGLGMSWSKFKTIAQSTCIKGDPGYSSYFRRDDLIFIAKILGVKVHQLHSAPKYRIEQIIETKQRPAKLKAELFKALPYCQQSVRNKWKALSGDRNGFTTEELNRIAEMLQVPSHELLHGSHSN